MSVADELLEFGRIQLLCVLTSQVLEVHEGYRI
jgi:hypothetical protein